LKKNLILTGMMGVGKSTVGKKLSIKLNMEFIDTDKVVEINESMSISEIFKQKGEAHFRGIEKNVCMTILKKKNCVIALGGGAFINSVVREMALNRCVCFWLDIETKLLSKRLLGTKKRPLINSLNLEKSLTAVYEKRKDLYGLADFKIDCNKSSAPLITKKIAKIYETRPN